MMKATGVDVRRPWGVPTLLLLAGGLFAGCGEPTVDDEVVEMLTDQSIAKQDAECVANGLHDAGLTDEQLELMAEHDIQVTIPEGEEDPTLVLGLDEQPDGHQTPSDDDVKDINAALAAAAEKCLES